MRGRDGRSLRVALISDAILNAAPGSAGDRRRLVLDALAAAGVSHAAHGDADHGPLVDGVLDDLARRAAAHTAQPPSWTAAAAGAAGQPVH